MKFKKGVHVAYTTYYETQEYYDTRSGMRIWRITRTQRTHGGYGLGNSKIYFEVEG